MGSNNDNNNNKGVFPWLKSLPVAPEYHPTLAEFKDPIAYVYKIEPEASKYGICKIIPPLPNVSKKMVVANFNKSVTTFTTRQQQIGFCPRKHRPVQRPVWQSGERYTLPEFEAKAKAFERSYLRKRTNKVLTALEMESLYWEASGDKVITVEYANDMPGSAFGPVRGEDEEEEKTVGDTAWNMRAVSRAKGSLLRFMKAEIPGVTSPMVYISMLFSWFAWHVEDHDLHSLNFMHMGAGKTWYGVPRGASVAFEEVIRVHGYGGEINPLATFAILGEKTTVMSPEVLVNAGVPCCRLMQNAGEFVVTFPRAYHSGFSHGYNCGEAANIATPEWLRVAKEAAIRRASINCPPMVSHFQLLYDLALSFCSRIPKTVSSEPKSSRLRDRKKGEGETFIKESFVKDVMTNNDLLHVLGDGASVVLLPQSSLDDSNLSNSRISSLLKGRLSVGLISPLQEVKSSKSLAYGSFMPVKKSGLKTFIGANPKKGKLSSKYNGNKISLLNNSENGCNIGSEGDKPTDQGLFSCVTCGILNFACVAIVQPTEMAAKHLMSTTDGSFFDCQSVGSGVAMCLSEQNPRNGKRGQSAYDLQLYDIPVHSDDSRPLNKESKVVISDIGKEKGPSSLGLLALAYGNSSDSEEELDPVCESESRSSDDAHDYHNNFPPGTPNRRRDNGTQRSYDCSSDVETNDVAFTESNAYLPFEKTTMASVPRCNEDSSKLHLFCVHHAAEVVQLLRPIGGAHVFLLCHPDYPELEAEAKLVAEEMGISYVWNDIRFREATEEDENQIRSALQCEEGLHGNADWTVKLGINLFYTVNLSRSPLYSKQMAYNSIIYKAFGRTSQDYNATQTKVQSKVLGRQKKIVTAGKWCGKVWMSNQVHPLLAVRETEEEEEKREADTPENPEVKREREIYSRKKPQLKQERMLEKVEPSQFTSTIRKSMRKRKSTFKAEKLLEGKTTKTEDSFNASDYSGDETIPQPRRTLRNKKPKKEVSVPVRRTIDRNKRKLNTDDETEDSFNASDDETILQPMRTLRNKKPQKEVSVPVKRTIDRNKRKLITDDETEDSFNASDDSGHETIPQPMRTLRNKKPKKEVSVPVRRTIDRNKRKLIIDDEIEGGPSTRLRRRIVKPRKDLLETNRVEAKPILKRHKPIKKMKRPSAVKAPAPNPEVEDENEEEDNNEERECTCDIEGCTMRFSSKEDLIVHKRNVCLIEGCGKKFFSHKYLLQHRRVHEDDRPLKCPWKGCHMAFKWAWARTEHIRVHTGARPYVCLEEGCGQTFRFVSDFSRHKRKTGHSIKKNEG